jgi:predicted Zn-dependent protease
MPNSIFSPDAFFAKIKTSADWVGLRFVRESTANRVVRNELPDSNSSETDDGVMIEVLIDGHFGHAGTADISDDGLQRAFNKAVATSKSASRRKAFAFSTEERPKAIGSFQSSRTKSLDKTSLSAITDSLLAGCKAMKVSDRIVNRRATAMIVQTEINFFSSNGSETKQIFDMVDVNLSATAARGTDSQTRSYSQSGQWGGEIFDRTIFEREGLRVSEESLELLDAENCPEERIDLILMPDQMMLQIHESIGHPLELDRILGDERNYAGWSFVNANDFGKLQYGSKLMNITFDPTKTNELASYTFDDTGNRATREFLIKDGVLLRGLGSLESQKRSGLKGVANSRSASWNRAPIDRMANINLEPGTSSIEQMISGIERGVIMMTNRSWSIDDYRNKFQFGCEYAKRIENGRITKTLKNPNYRGTTVDFWNRLVAVGNTRSVETFGTPYCGKGEPSQVIRVGHASPPCLFRGVEVFGGGL